MRDEAAAVFSRVLVICAVLAVASACGSTTVTATEFPVSCSVDSDCAPVFFGSMCGPCGGCSNAAISTSAKASYDAEVAAAVARCPPKVGPQPACAPCMQRLAGCDAGTCVLR